MIRLDGRRFLITGAASGIGAATALLAAGLGAACDIVDVADCAPTEAAIRRAGGVCFAHRIDVSDSSAVADVISHADGLSAYVACAAISPPDIWREDDWAQSYDRAMAIDLRGNVFGARAAFARFEASGGGAIVLVGSLAGRTGGTTAAAEYAAAKGGLHAFARWLARKGGPLGIRVNVVAPASIATPMMADTKVDLGAVPLQRMGEASEVAGPIVFLCSDAAAYVTGTVLDVNGGAWMG